VNKTDYSGVKALVAVDQGDLRAGLLAAFGRAGIKDPREADDEPQLQRILAEADLDLIVMNDALGGVFVAPLISKLRRGEIGTHPFPVVVILADPSDPAARRRISDCGPDDIVDLPVSAVDLLQRIGIFVSGGRKPLVVTKAYAGPERRDKKRAAANPQ